MPVVRFFVTGRVQGVAFRAHTRDRALALGLRGHAKNLSDGRVEVLAAGPEERIAALARWLAVGPPLARVDHVEQLLMIDASDPVPPGFATL